MFTLALLVFYFGELSIDLFLSLIGSKYGPIRQAVYRNCPTSGVFSITTFPPSFVLDYLVYSAHLYEVLL